MGGRARRAAGFALIATIVRIALTRGKGDMLPGLDASIWKMLLLVLLAGVMAVLVILDKVRLCPASS